jgi:5-bromo-4-chloroindolyl phosphate hydrolysis protein
MSIDKELREELRQAADALHCPPGLYGRVRHSYQHYVNEKRGRSPMKKRILAGIAAAAILIPSAAFAASYLADDIFGSSATIEQHGGTQEDYQVIEEGLQKAKSKLTEDEFKTYMELSKQLVQLKLKITDENGVRHEEKLTEEEQQQLEQLASRLAPYFEKINGTSNP